VLTQEAAVKLDPVGQEDKDIDNDRDVDTTDKYLHKRRKAISAAIASSKNESSLSDEDIAKLKDILGEQGVAEGAMSDLDADRKDRQYQSRQAKTTMKHIPNPTAGEKAAAKDIKPGIAGYRDRIDMLKSAEARGGLKKEEAEQVDEAGVKEEDETVSEGRPYSAMQRIGRYGSTRGSSYLDLGGRREAPPAPKPTPTAPKPTEDKKKNEDFELIENLNFALPEHPSYQDFIKAALTIAECNSFSELSEEDQQYIISEMEDAFRNNDLAFIAEAEALSDMNDTVQRLRKAGHRIEDMGKDYKGQPYYVYVDKGTGLRRKVTYKGNQKVTQNMGKAAPEDTNEA
jgi:hypothetical protein